MALFHYRSTVYFVWLYRWRIHTTMREREREGERETSREKERDRKRGKDVCTSVIMDWCSILRRNRKVQNTFTHYNTLYHTATHSNTLQCTATHCNILENTQGAASVALPLGQFLTSFKKLGYVVPMQQLSTSFRMMM